jgi:hypothetical protein
VKTFSLISVLSVGLLVLIVPATAAQIDFEAQAAGRGGVFTGSVDSPLNIDIGTFTGGELLHGVVGMPANQTGVLATWLFTPAATNPLVVTFSLPVTGFSVQVFNGGEAQNYTVSSDAGESITRSINSVGSGGFSTFSLERVLTRVDILGASQGWNFAIDNVTYEAIPEPGTDVFAAGAFAVLLGIRRFSAGGSR